MLCSVCFYFYGGGTTFFASRSLSRSRSARFPVWNRQCRVQIHFPSDANAVSRLWESSPRPSRFGFRRNDSAVLFFLAFLHSFLRTHFCLERSSLGKVCGLEFAAALLCSDAHVVRVLLFIHHALMLTVVYLKNIRALFFIEKKNFSALPSNAANAALGGRGV